MPAASGPPGSRTPTATRWRSPRSRAKHSRGPSLINRTEGHRRLLITRLLVAEGALKRPLLYLILYLKQNRDDYYDHLQRIRTDGAWEAWLRFFLEGVVEVAEATTATAFRVHDLAARLVVFRPTTAAKVLELGDPPVYAAVRRLEEAGLLREVTGRPRGKLYV